MVGILVSFWEGLFLGAFGVSFRECNTTLLDTVKCMKSPACLVTFVTVPDGGMVVSWDQRAQGVEAQSMM